MGVCVCICMSACEFMHVRMFVYIQGVFFVIRHLKLDVKFFNVTVRMFRTHLARCCLQPKRVQCDNLKAHHVRAIGQVSDVNKIDLCVYTYTSK